MKELLCNKLASITFCDDSFGLSDSLIDGCLDTTVGGDGESWLLSTRGFGQRSQHGR